MKTMIGLLVISFLMIAFLLPASAQAQTAVMSLTGPSCEGLRFKSLRITEHQQDELRLPWCWAATAQIVMEYHGTTREQCVLVDAVLQREQGIPRTPPNCCTPLEHRYTWGSGCYKFGWPEWVFDIFGFFYLPPHTSELTKLNWIDATEEICQNRPYISTIGPSLDDTHSEVIHGYYIKILSGSVGSSIHPTIVLLQVQVYDPQDDPDDSYWNWERYTYGAQSPYYTHFKDTFKIRRRPWLLPEPPFLRPFERGRR